MKTTLFTFLMSLLLVISLTSKAQSGVKKINPVAEKHYTPDEINQMSAKDAEKLNYYYTESFKIIGSGSGLEMLIQKYCGTSELDITCFERHRKKNQENWFADEQFPEIKIVLQSWDDLENEYRKIDNR